MRRRVGALVAVASLLAACTSTSDEPAAPPSSSAPTAEASSTLASEGIDWPRAGAPLQVSDPPAATAGIRAGDVIVAIDGDAVASSDDLRAAIDGLAVGDEVTITVQRDGEREEIDVTLGERPA